MENNAEKTLSVSLPNSSYDTSSTDDKPKMIPRETLFKLLDNSGHIAVLRSGTQDGREVSEQPKTIEVPDVTCNKSPVQR